MGGRSRGAFALGGGGSREDGVGGGGGGRWGDLGGTCPQGIHQNFSRIRSTTTEF